MGPTLQRYFLREVAVPFCYGIGVFTFILLIARMLKLVELVVNRGVPLIEIGKLFAYILPTFLEVTVPMALLLAVLLSFGRLSSDSEIVALKTSGISLYQMTLPILLFTAAVYGLSLMVSVYVRPWANTRLKASLYEIAKTRASAGLRERVFNDDFASLVIYVEHIEPPGEQLAGILIADNRDPSQRNTVLAKRGVLVSEEATQNVTLRLLDGTIHTSMSDDRSYHKTDFTVYDVSLSLSAALARFSQREKDAKEMSLGELRAAIAAKTAAGRPANTERIELHRKFSVPFACLVFGLVAIPLGLHPVRSVKSRGFSVSLALIFLYYLVLTAGEAMAIKGTLPAVVAMWLPNVLFAMIGLALFASAAREIRLSLAGRVRLAFAARWGRSRAVSLP